jgi:hypothetical protein
MSRERKWFGPIKAALGAIAVLSVLYVFFMAGPAIETRFFPVLSTMRIVSVNAETDNSSFVKTEFSKLRSCEYIGISWYYGQRAGLFERVSMVPVRNPDDTSAPNRATGEQRAGPWRVTIPAQDVRSRSFVQVYHRCHPFWTTMSEFYP